MTNYGHWGSCRLWLHTSKQISEFLVSKIHEFILSKSIRSLDLLVVFNELGIIFEDLEAVNILVITINFVVLGFPGIIDWGKGIIFDIISER
jgi:hypothetical protein